jgi:hypothetical protein
MEVYIDLIVDLSRLLECHFPCVGQECTRLMKFFCGMCNVGSSKKLWLEYQTSGLEAWRKRACH